MDIGSGIAVAGIWLWLWLIYERKFEGKYSHLIHLGVVVALTLLIAA
jgi:hypothetical protein